MITTRESINYQFSLIFGYSSPKDIIVGNVLGPGKLTSVRVNELSQDVIRFLRMYNAILRDYTGSELFYAEFELFNFDEKDARINIYPKSMLLIPGNYKECESLLLALKPDTGYLDTHKSRESIDDISKLFFEVEEFTDHPKLDSKGKSKLLKSFAERFSKKLYGELIEDKWNKKLIGISISLPTDEDMLKTYGSIKNDVEIFWNKNPFELNFFNPIYEKFQTPFDGQMAIEHLKYLISEPSANFLVENTLKLGTSLMKLANTGTIDESQDRILFYLIKKIREEFGAYQENCSIEWITSYFEDFCIRMEKMLNQFLEVSNEFLASGVKGDLTHLVKKFYNLIEEKNDQHNNSYRDLFELASFSINQTIRKDEDLIAIELNSAVNYFAEIFKNTFNLMKKSLPRFLYRKELISLIDIFIRNLNEKFEKEQKPAKALGQNLLTKFESVLLNKIEFNSITLIKNYLFDLDSLIKEFKKIVIEALPSFIKEVKLSISDLVSFAEIQMEGNSGLIEKHLSNFEKFSSELRFLVNYILRYSTINRFLKEENDIEISDPVTFANKFYRFLEKRMGGIDLIWKSYVLEWVKDYAKRFFKIEEKRDWSLNETYTDFVEYIEKRESFEQNEKQFLIFLDKYIINVLDETEKYLLLDFYEKFEFCIDIKLEFPKYVQKIIETEVNLIKLNQSKVPPNTLLNISEKDSFYKYINENEVKYFSKLIPRPKSIILKHCLTNEEKDLFSSTLFHVVNFKYWHSKSKFEISDNFKEVYREWIKEL
ncbi:MAG: hypothetical protein ACFE8M_00495 [Candidatus Hermodarchaeota archaeon]